MMLLWPTGHSYGINQMLDHRMFNKLYIIMFCLSKRCLPFTRLSSFTQILKATLALRKCKIPYMLSLGVEIHAMKKFWEDLTQHSWEIVIVCVWCLYIITCWLGFCVVQIHFIFALHQGPTTWCKPTNTPHIHRKFPALHTSSWCQPWHVQGLIFAQPSWWMLSPHLTSWWDTLESPSISEIWTSGSSQLDQ